VVREGGRSALHNFFENGFGGVNYQNYYTLIHINPSCDNGNYNYNKRSCLPIYDFASDYVFQEISKKYQTLLLSYTINLFGSGGEVAANTVGAVSAGHLFEKICLWLPKQLTSLNYGIL
jgi:hypothetical protein